MRVVPGAAFGVALSGAVPTASPALPPITRNNRYFLAADLRLDNRSEILTALGNAAAGIADVSDAGLLLEAWSRWGESCLDQLVGDFALAIFDIHERKLTLARDATGQRPLFFAQGESAIGFASMPSGLLELPMLRRGWNMRRLADALQDFPPTNAETYFSGIFRVMPGQLVSFANGRQESRFYWQPALDELNFAGNHDYVEAYRDLLDNAVKCRMRGTAGPVAVHLSAGYDSSAVAATAAMQSRVAGPVAYTFAPSPAFKGPVPRGRMADESALARLTAEMHGMEHQIVHSSPLTLDYLRRQAINYQEPARNLINGVWCADILRAAASRGATTLLTGSMGNLTLNAGGLRVLADWVRTGRFGEWWRQALSASARDDVRWRGLLFNSFGPWLPASAWHGLRRMFMGVESGAAANFLQHEWVHNPSDFLARELSEQPTGNTPNDRLQMIRHMDPGPLMKGAVAEAGIDELDPTADRRIAEFSLRLPPNQLLDHGVIKPLAREALKDRVPAAVLDAPLRGIQMADWSDRFQQAHALEILEEVQTSLLANGLLSLAKIRSSLESWPREARFSMSVADKYARKLPIALATAVFMKEHERSC